MKFYHTSEALPVPGKPVLLYKPGHYDIKHLAVQYGISGSGMTQTPAWYPGGSSIDGYWTFLPPIDVKHWKPIAT